MKKTWAALGCAVALAGCQPAVTVEKVGVTPQRKQQDIDNCKIASFKQIPQAMGVGSTGGYSSPGTTYCNTIGTQVMCNTVGGVNVPTSTYSYDQNQDLRDRWIAGCLRNHGYIVKGI